MNELIFSTLLHIHISKTSTVLLLTLTVKSFCLLIKWATGRQVLQTVFEVIKKVSYWHGSCIRTVKTSIEPLQQQPMQTNDARQQTDCSQLRLLSIREHRSHNNSTNIKVKQQHKIYINIPGVSKVWPVGQISPTKVSDLVRGFRKWEEKFKKGGNWPRGWLSRGLLSEGLLSCSHRTRLTCSMIYCLWPIGQIGPASQPI